MRAPAVYQRFYAVQNKNDAGVTPPASSHEKELVHFQFYHRNP